MPNNLKVQIFNFSDVSLQEKGELSQKRLQVIKDMGDPFTVQLLPWMWPCQQTSNSIRNCAKKAEGIVRALQEIAKNKCSWILSGSFPQTLYGKLYDRGYIINDTGEIVMSYDRSHLVPSIIKNDALFNPGNKPAIFSLGPVICGYVLSSDILFPEYIRALALSGVKVLFIAAASMENIECLECLIRARALENQLFVIAVLRCETGQIMNAMIIGPDGMVVSKSEKDETILNGFIDVTDVDKKRRKVRFLQSRRPDLYLPLDDLNFG